MAMSVAVFCSRGKNILSEEMIHAQKYLSLFTLGATQSGLLGYAVAVSQMVRSTCNQDNLGIIFNISRKKYCDPSLELSR